MGGQNRANVLNGAGGYVVGAAATSWRLCDQSLESMTRERVMSRTVDGDVLPDTTRSQMHRLPPVLA